MDKFVNLYSYIVYILYLSLIYYKRGINLAIKNFHTLFINLGFVKHCQPVYSPSKKRTYRQQDVFTLTSGKKNNKLGHHSDPVIRELSMTKKKSNYVILNNSCSVLIYTLKVFTICIYTGSLSPCRLLYPILFHRDGSLSEFSRTIEVI